MEHLDAGAASATGVSVGAVCLNRARFVRRIFNVDPILGLLVSMSKGANMPGDVFNAKVKGATTYRRAAVIAICISAALLLTWAAVEVPAFTRSVAVQFDWQQTKGFRSISVEWPPLGSLYSRLIVSQARSHIATEIEKAGWRSAKGQLNVRVFCLFFVLGIDHFDAWNVHIIDPEVTPLMYAVEDGDIGSAERIIASGANVNAQDQRGWTALMHASMKGQVNGARLLLAAGADPNIRDRDGRTAFLWAAWSCRSDVAIALIHAGVDVNVKDRYGNSALSSTPCPQVFQEILNKAKAHQSTNGLRN